MTQQAIAVGSIADDGTGDPARDAFIKVNENFTELYKSFVVSANGPLSTTNGFDLIAYEIPAGSLAGGDTLIFAHRSVVVQESGGDYDVDLMMEISDDSVTRFLPLSRASSNSGPVPITLVNSASNITHVECSLVRSGDTGLLTVSGRFICRGREDFDISVTGRVGLYQASGFTDTFTVEIDLGVLPVDFAAENVTVRIKLVNDGEDTTPTSMIFRNNSAPSNIVTQVVSD